MQACDLRPVTKPAVRRGVQYRWRRTSQPVLRGSSCTTVSCCFASAEAASGNAHNAEVQQHQALDDDLPSVWLIAGCNIQQGPTQFCRGQLGVQPLPHTVHSSEDDDQQAFATHGDMVVTISDGQVLALSFVDTDDPVPELDAKALQPELQQRKWESSLSASRTVQLARMQSERVNVNDCMLDTGPDQAVY